MNTKKNLKNGHETNVTHEADATEGEVSMKTDKKVPSSIAATVAAPAEGPLTEAQVTAMLGQLDSIAIVLAASNATPLTIDERRRLPKMKKGGEQKMPGILDLADRYEVSIPGGSTDDARADIELVKTLQPLFTRLVSMVGLVGDTILQANGRSWTTTTLAYTVLVRLVKRFPALQRELTPMASFMARVHKDAPANLRTAEAGTLAKGRETKKAKKAAASAAAAAAKATSAVTTQATSETSEGAAASTSNGTAAAAAPATTTPTTNGTN